MACLSLASSGLSLGTPVFPCGCTSQGIGVQLPQPPDSIEQSRSHFTGTHQLNQPGVLDSQPCLGLRLLCGKSGGDREEAELLSQRRNRMQIVSLKGSASVRLKSQRSLYFACSLRLSRSTRRSRYFPASDRISIKALSPIASTSVPTGNRSAPAYTTNFRAGLRSWQAS